MSAFLKAYLIVTGALSLLVFAMPWLVIIGYFFLLLPGVILSLMPTAFLWGLIYASARLALCFVMPEKMATMAGFAVLALIVCLIPQPSRIAAYAALKAHHLDPVAAKGQIRPKGHIRIDINSPGWDNANRNKLKTRPYKCDARCLALLFEPGVESVTINDFVRNGGIPFEKLKAGQSVLHADARTYRLVPKAACGDEGLIADSVSGHFAATPDEARAQAMEWTQRLSSDLCLIGEAPRADYDMLLRMGDWMSGPWVKDLSLDHSPVTISLAEILRGDGTVLFRDVAISTSALSMPFRTTMDGGMENYRFVWARSTMGQRPTSLDPQRKAVDDLLIVRRTGDPVAALAATRKALSATLADPAATKDAPAFKGVDDYLTALTKTQPTPEDVALIEALIREPRLNDLDGSGSLPDILDAQQLNRLRPIIATKLLTLPPEARPDSSMLGRALQYWPDGAFVALVPEEEALLNDLMARRRATGLIRRLSDQGSKGAQRLADMIGAHMDALGGYDRKTPGLSPAERDHGYSAHRSAIGVAVDALCQLGPDAQATLPNLIAQEAKPAFENMERRGWDRMLVRLGRPAAQIMKPKRLSGSQDRYQANLESFLKAYRPDRGC